MSVSFYVHKTNLECNFSNANAAAIFKVLDEPLEWCGSWKSAKLLEIHDKIRNALSDNETMKKGTRQTIIRTNFISFGLEIEDVKMRLQLLLQVVSKAVETNNEVHWS
jgi:hypothetical protein